MVLYIYLIGDVGRVWSSWGEGDGWRIVWEWVGSVGVTRGGKRGLVNIALGLRVTCTHESHMIVR